MITPTKGISPQRALLSVAAQVTQVLDQPLTVTETWELLLTWRMKARANEPISFIWFSYALDVLFACGLIYYDDGLLRRIEDR